jgi:predicted enzyme related to lactoylglutathione lyase/GNAT superfamily N-acetyltransferase
VQVKRLGAGQVDELLAAGLLFDAPADPSAARQYLADDRNVFFLAADEDRAVGFLRGTALRQVHTNRDQMFLYEIAVAEDRRRTGVGRALVGAFLDYCTTHGFEEAFVFTDPGNPAAVGLYRSTGAVTETPADRMFVYRLNPPDAAKKPSETELAAYGPPAIFRPNGISFLEIPSVDPVRSADFYQAVFGWSTSRRSSTLAFGDGTGHVIGHWTTDRPPADDAGVRFYVYVPAIDETIYRALDAGAKVVREPYREGDLWVALLRDPSGNLLGVWQQDPG